MVGFDWQPLLLQVMHGLSSMSLWAKIQMSPIDGTDSAGPGSSSTGQGQYSIHDKVFEGSVLGCEVPL